MTTENNFDSDLDTLRNSLQYFCRIVLNSANFYYGTGVNLFLSMGGNLAKEPFSFSPKVNSLFKDQSKRPLAPIRIALLSAKNIQLQRALEQATDAITRSSDAGLHCYRAIEAIRRDFLNGKADEGSAKKKSWTDMNNSLKLTQAFYSLIKTHADVSRHGGLKDITSPEMEDILHKTWAIIDRYLVYLNSGRKPLDHSYPELN